MTNQAMNRTASSAAGAPPAAGSPDGASGIDGLSQFISFAIGDDQYGVDIMAVREIKGWSQITALPRQPDYMRGVLNLRGVMVPIIDLRCRFGQGMTEATALHIVIVVQIGARHVGLLADRVLDLAWSHGQVVLRQLNATEADAQLFGRLESSILYANPARRANPSLLLKNRRGQSGLWGQGISGDRPIVLVRIAGASASSGARPRAKTKSFSVSVRTNSSGRASKARSRPATPWNWLPSGRPPAMYTGWPSSSVRQRPTASNCSREKPTGSISRWQPAQETLERCSARRSRATARRRVRTGR